ncbi:hypothetical protein [Glycomyces paridis]|uniref:Uncharacterized protein n=1 Tax=Glycomyces paridis TaxID=2126555 RepID=A0A4S8PES9_9ACTN|nr:hypothetical protein [Glycomyces paridis]THV26799.1 hypothetical protein E9998_17595 [Glycomyces paridis]
MNDELPDRLRVGAEEFEPDRDRMWARVADGMREVRAERAAPARTRWRAPLAAMAAGAAVVLIGVIVLLGQTIGLGPVLQPTPGPPAAEGETPSAGPPETTGGDEGTTSSSTSEPAGEGTGETTTGEDAETTAETPDVPEWLFGDAWIDQGSNEYWTQVNMKLQTEVDLTEVTVELKLALGEGLDDTGAYSTNNTLFNEAVVTEEDGFLVYRWTLKDGAVLPPDDYQLAAQVAHTTWRDAAEDAFTITVLADSGEDAEVEGGLL